MKKLLFTFCFLSIVFFGKAQKGNITLVESDAISSLVEKHVFLNSRQKIIGWRIQIFFDSGNNSKSKAYSRKGVFMAMYPDVSVYLMFQSPYYKVRVGDFRTRMDAEGFKQKLLGEFPDAFVVKDEIRSPGF
jgi:hypothetical protein